MLSTDSDLLQRLSAPFSETYERDGAGGKKFQYIPVQNVAKRLNAVFGLCWSFDVVSHIHDGDFAIVHGRLTIHRNGKTYRKDQFGSATIQFKKSNREPLDIGNDFKSAASDALKKCATLVGVGLYLSDSGKMTDEQRQEIESLVKEKGQSMSADMEAMLDAMSETQAIELIASLRGATA